MSSLKFLADLRNCQSITILAEGFDDESAVLEGRDPPIIVHSPALGDVGARVRRCHRSGQVALGHVFPTHHVTSKGPSHDGVHEVRSNCLAGCWS